MSHAPASDAMGLLPASTAERLRVACRGPGGVGVCAPRRIGCWTGGFVEDVEKSGTRAHSCSSNAVRRAVRERLGLRAVTAELSRAAGQRRSVGVGRGA